MSGSVRPTPVEPRPWWDHEQRFTFEGGPRDGEVLLLLTASRQWSIAEQTQPGNRYVNVRGTNRYLWVRVGPVDRGWTCSCPLDVTRPDDPGCPVHRWVA